MLRSPSRPSSLPRVLSRAAAVGVAATATFRRPGPARPHRLTRAGLAGTLVLGLAGAGLLAATPASAATYSQASGRFLNVAVGGVPSDPVLALNPATAVNKGEATPVTNTTALDATALNSVGVSLGSGINLLGNNGLLTLGAVNQYAQATNTGTSKAASGAVSDDGAIGAGNAASFPADASLNLTPLLSRVAVVNAGLSAASVQLGAISSTATGSTAAASGTYQIAGGNLVLTSPVVAAIPGLVNAQIAAANTATAALGGPNGSLATALRAIPAVATVLNALGQPLTVNASVTANLAPVSALLATPLHNADNSIVIDLAAGTITVDLTKFAGGLNGQAPDTEIISATTLNSVASQVTTLIGDLVTNVNTTLNAQLRAAAVAVTATAGSTTGVAPTGVDIHVNGTVASVLNGTATGTSTAVVSGAPVNLPLSTVLAALATPINAALFTAPNGVVPAAATALNTGITQPVTNTLAPALRAVNQLVSLTVNHQATTSGTFSETAARLAVIPGSPALASTDLATSSVGPNPGVPAAPTATGLTPATGPTSGGQTVTVTGTNFDTDTGGTTVTIGGTTVAATATSATALTFTAPAHAAGDVGVTVTTGGGTTTPALTYTYVTPPVPTSTSLNPSAGPVAGGTVVTVAGTGFIPGATVSIGGTTVTPTAITPTAVTFTTPAHAAGAVDVTVTTAGGTTTPALTFTYAARPTTASLTPNRGPTAGGQSVTVTGTGFLPGTTVTVDGQSVTPDAITATTVRFTTPAHAAGPVDVTVTTPGGTSTPALTYTYLGAPTAAALVPTSGPTTGGQTVTVTGTGFVAGATTVQVDGTTVPATVTLPTTLTFTTPAHAAGAVDVTVTTPGGTSAARTYTYVGPPTAASLTPTSGPQAGGTSVTIAGTGFTAGSVVTVDGVPAVVTSTSPTSITFVTAPHLPGDVDVTVTTTGGTTAPLTYTYLPVPVTTSLDPDAGPTTGGTAVTITGTGFTPGSTVTVDGATVTPDTVTGTQIVFTTPAHTAGPVLVTVTTPGGISIPPLTFTYLPRPTASGIVPDSGPTSGGQTVTIAGTGFVPGATTVDIGGNAATVVATTPTTVTVTTPAHAAGDTAVTVTTAGGTSTPRLTYTYLDPPTATALSPDAGPVTGNQTVTVVGTGFAAGTTVSVGGVPVPASVDSSTSLTFRTPAHLPGTVGVTVTTPGGTTTPALDYTFVAAPTALALTPGSGPTTGAQTVTVTGTGFVDGATSVTIGGVVVPAGAVDVTSPTSLAFTTPAHAAGAVGVSVTTAGGTSTPALPYLYLGAPTASSLAPTSGPTTGAQTVTVTGTGFVIGATTVTIGGVTVPAVVTSTTSLTFATPPHAAGPVTVTVTTPGGTTAALSYTYRAAPTASALQPESGPTAGGQTVTVTGNGFVDGATTVIVGITPVMASVDSSTSLTYTTPAHIAGPVDVIVQTAGGVSLPLVYTYVAAPTTVSLTPASGPTVGGQTVTVTGVGFVAGATTVDVDGTTVAAQVDSPASLRFITPAHAAGPVDVTVTTPGGTSDPALTYTYVAAPTASSLSPTAGPVTGGNTVTVTGTGFTAGTAVTVDGVPVLAVNVVSSTSLTFTAPVHPAGLAEVVVSTAGGTTTALGYRYLPLPVAATLVPASGPTAGGQTVTVTGTGFVAGATTVTIDGTDVPATVTSATRLTFDTPAHAAGLVDVSVTTPAGTTAVPLLYTYLDGPSVSSLNPTSGPITGGQTVTVTGAGFVALATEVTIGGIPVPAVVDSSTSLTFVTPPHAAGGVGVTVTTPGGTSDPAQDYTYLAVPLVTGVNPDLGPAAGGQTVTLTGTGFVSGGTAVTIGGITVPAASVTVNSPTSLTFTTPAHAAGAVTVTASTDGGTSLPLPYVYLPAPTALTLNPGAGPAAGGQTVTVVGTGFRSGDTSVAVDGVTVAATVITPATLTFVTPAHAPGAVDVTVSTGGGTSAPLAYTYLPAPTVTGLDPDAGPTTGGQIVTVSGTGFTAGTTVHIGGTTVVGLVESATRLSFPTPPHAAGQVQVTVSAQGGTSDPATYTYVAAPSVTSLDPDSGPTAGGQTVTATGTGFVAGATTVQVDTTTIPASQVTVMSPTSLTFTTPAHVVGPTLVTVITAGGPAVPTTYTYLPAPTLLGLDPDRGPAAGGQNVTVTGVGFVTGATVTIGGTTVAAVVQTPTTLTFTTPAHAAGDVDVTVTTPGGDSQPQTYTYVAAPTVSGLDPTRGPVAGGQTVTVTGTGFVDPATTVTIGNTTVPATVVTSTELMFTTPAHAAGAVGVVVTTPGGTSAPVDYTYVPAPTAASLNPTRGPVVGGQTVTVTGTGFVTGATDVTIGGTTVAANVASSTSLTFLTPAHAAGGVDVTVTTPGGTSAARGYTYLDVPTASAIDPTQGPTTGGQTVTVTGTGFVAGATDVTIGGVTLTGGEVSVDSSTSLTVTTPAHAAGPVDVTVTTPGGTSGAQTYTYVTATAPVPTLSGLDPARGPVAGGQTVTVTGSGFVPRGTTIEIGGITVPASTTGSIADGVVVDSPTQLTFRTPPHAAGGVQVTVTTDGGTSTPGDYTYVPAGPGPRPDPPTITAPATGSSTTDPHPLISGRGVPGDTVSVYDGTTLLCTATVGADGRWSCRSEPALGLGAHGLTATQTSPTGVTSLASPVTVVTVVPVPPVTTSPTPGQQLPPGSPISGTGQPGATIIVSEGGDELCTTTVDADGTWECTPNPPLGPGPHTVTVTQELAGAATRRTAVTFEVGAAGASRGTGGLAYTGTPAERLGLLGLVLLLGGVGLLVGARGRRSRR